MASILAGKIKYMQYKRIQRALEDPIYLLDSDNDHLKIAGTTRNVYTVKYYPTLQCDCPDSKREFLCKHICFVICKICKLYDENIFQTYQISNNQLILIRNRLKTIWITEQTEDIVDTTLRGLFQKLTTDDVDGIDDTDSTDEDIECVICFNDITSADYSKCSTCKNKIHKSCLQKWLERNNTCVFCRSLIQTETDNYQNLN